MTEAESDDDPAAIDGCSLDRAAEIVISGEDDPAEVRETLGIVTHEGVVDRSAVDDAVANASMVVTTAETRVELAADKLDGAQAAAAAAPELEFVSDRVQNFEARLSGIKNQATALGEAIQEILSMKETGDLYVIARRIKRVTNAATEVQRAADDFQLELDAFESWLTDPDQRIEELTADVDALADSLGELDATVETLDSGDGESGTEAADRWIAAKIRHRVLSLMLTDLQAELTAVQTWAEDEGETPPSDIKPQLDELQTSHAGLGDRLNEHADPEWVAQFDDELSALDDALEAMEPPVVWPDVEAVVAEHRPDVV